MAVPSPAWRIGGARALTGTPELAESRLRAELPAPQESVIPFRAAPCVQVRGRLFYEVAPKPKYATITKSEDPFMKRLNLSTYAIACLLPGVWLNQGSAQDIVHLNGRLMRWSDMGSAVLRPATADNWTAGNGNWGTASNWSAGVPTSSSAVSISGGPGGTVTENVANASAGSLSVQYDFALSISSGNTLTVAGTTSITNSGYLYLGTAGGGTLNSGSFTNNANVEIGGSSNTAASLLAITGTLNNSGGEITLTGGSSSAASASIDVSGAAPATLTGTYNIEANKGPAIVEFGSGGITAIGDGSNNSGDVSLYGPNAYMEVGATNSNSALSALANIAENGQLNLFDGATVTTKGALTNNDGYLELDTNGSGGSTLTVGGDLSNSNGADLFVGNSANTSASTVTVQGTLSNTNSQVEVIGGGTAAAHALINVTGAAPSTLTGYYSVQGNTGYAAIEFGSGSITSIGDGASNSGTVALYGPNAFMEIGATNNESALTSLTTVAGNGQLDLFDGASLTTKGAVTSSGYLEVDTAGSGGSVLTIGGSLTNSNDGDVYVGNGGMTSPALLKVSGTLNNAGSTVLVTGGSAKAATAILDITGAAPGTLAGVYDIFGGSGTAAVEFGSGSITAIGAGAVVLTGPNAYMEIGATNSESALTSLTSIGGTGELYLRNGASLSTSGALTNSGYLEVDDGGPGGGILSIGGNLTNSAGGGVYVGNSGITSASKLTVSGTLSNNGSYVDVTGGATKAATALLDVTGAAPSALTGTYALGGGVGSSAVEFGSGSVTAIGTTGNAGSVMLDGANAYMEIGATNSESALTSVATIAATGSLYLTNGASLTTTGAMTNSGYLEVDGSAGGGSVLTIGGPLTNNNGDIYVGEISISSAATLNVSGTFNSNGGGYLQVQGGDVRAASALLNVAGAAPSTLTGTYDIVGSTGSAAVEFGSGGITAIGDGAGNIGVVELSGPNAYMKVGATNNESALTSLTTIANNGTLSLYNGAALTTKAISNAGNLELDFGQNGGSTLTIKGALTNTGNVYVGYGTITSPAVLDLQGALTNSSTGGISVNGSPASGANSTFEITGPTLTNSGVITLNGSASEAILEIGGNVTTSGSGAIELTNTNTSLITGASANDTLTNGSTIEGAGTLSRMGIVNNGTISANQSTPLIVTPSSLGLNNQGTLSVSAGDTMQIGTAAGGALTNFSGTALTGGAYSVAGTLQFGASGTNIVTDAANISLTGPGAEIVDFGGNNVLTNLATIAKGGSFSLGSKFGTFTTTGNFTDNGTLSVGAGGKFIVDFSDGLTNFSGTTLTGGTYKISGALEFAGANIVTNDANITLTGAASKIEGKAGANGLANFAVNDGSFTLGSKRSFTTAGNFTDNGSLTIGSGDIFNVNGNLTNQSGTVLTGGSYNVSGTLQYNGADIVSNAATITLAGSSANIVNQNSVDALAGFNTNKAAGSFTLSGNASLSTTGGSFTNAGTFTVSTGGTFTVGGTSYNFTQTGGTTTVDGTLQSASTGSLALNGGNLYGTGTLNYSGVVDTATVTPGNSATSTGKLQVNGTYTQNSAGALDVTLGGATAGTQYDQLNVSGTASLSGTLNVTLASGYKPAVGTQFDILNASSISGTFSTIDVTDSSDTFKAVQVGNEIELTVTTAGPASSASAAQLVHPGLVRGGRYGREVLAGPRPLAAVAAAVAPAIAPAFAPGMPLGLKAFRPRDESGSPAATQASVGAGDVSAAGSLGLSPVSASAYNSMAATNHMRFECGVDVGALLKAGPKRLLKALWASPDSMDALNIGYITMTTAH
jgi:hypothetical protein